MNQTIDGYCPTNGYYIENQINKVNDEDLKEIRELAEKVNLKNLEQQNMHLLFDNAMLRLYLKYQLTQDKKIDPITGNIT